MDWETVIYYLPDTVGIDYRKLRYRFGTQKKFGDIPVLLLLVVLPGRESRVNLFSHAKIGSMNVYDRVDLRDIRFSICHT